MIPKSNIIDYWMNFSDKVGKLMKNISEIRQVRTNQRVLEYELTRKPVKNINLRIKPNGKIYVSANKRVAIKIIENFIQEKQEFIIRALDKYKERQEAEPSTPREYISGESIMILGKSLCLQVLQGNQEAVKYDDSFIYLTVKDKENTRRKEILINKWLKGLQVDVFDQICNEVHQMFKRYDVQYPIIKIRKMKSKWGSCQYKKGIITLNSKLIGFPRRCIEYVVLHEFAHFIHPNHSKKFYDFVGLLMPDWKDRKKELER